MLARKFASHQSDVGPMFGWKKLHAKVLMDQYSIRYPDPAIKVNDTVKIDLATGKITEFIRFDTGVVAMATGGRNMGRVGVVTHRERHDGGFNIVHIKDAIDNSFATRESNVFVIGKEKPWISLPKGKGVKVSLAGLLITNMLTLGSCRLPRRETVAVLYRWRRRECELSEKRRGPKFRTSPALEKEQRDTIAG